jgi:acyl transferase domain-containing protein
MRPRAVGAQGKSFSFDHRADGYGRGEGVVCIVLKSPESARASRDSVRAVIRNCGVNHSGHSAGLTAPSATGQAELIARVYQSAGLDPCETDFVEGHGTGTKLGDPIEVESVARVFTGSRCKSRPLYLGSAKSNFGT